MGSDGEGEGDKEAGEGQVTGRRWSRPAPASHFTRVCRDGWGVDESDASFISRLPSNIFHLNSFLF